MDPIAPQPGEELPAACAEARRVLSLMVTSSPGGAAGRALRRHVTECEPCRDLYRGTMASAARLGRALRVEREEDTRVRRHAELTRRARAAGSRPKPPRRFGLRLALLPAAVIFVLLTGGRLGRAEALVLLWDGGDVRAAGQRLGEDRPEVELEVGTWCETLGNARARIERGGAELELGVETRVLVEDPEAIRLHLLRGELAVQGAGLITTSFGVLEVGLGSARLDVREGTFRLRCDAGSVDWSGSWGTRRLEAGEELSSSSPFVPTR